MAIGLFKEAMLKIFPEPEEKKRLKKLEELLEEMERYVLPFTSSSASASLRLAL